MYNTVVNKDGAYITNTIESRLGEELVDLLAECGAILAGGAITSIATNAPVNDWDIYFKTKEGLLKFLVAALFNTEREVKLLKYSMDESPRLLFTHKTPKSVLFKSMDEDELNLQVISYRFFPNEYCVLNDFDYTVCMAAYDFQHKALVTHEDFLLHASQRYLKFNPGTRYPLVSVFRLDKYKERGYTISKAELMRLLTKITTLNITTWEEAEDHIGGMYGLAVGDVFDKKKEFSTAELMDQLSSVGDKLHTDFTSEDPRKYHEEYTYDQVIKTLFKDNFGVIPELRMQPLPGKARGSVYKFVKETDGELHSHMYPDFKYKVGVGYDLDPAKRGIWTENDPVPLFRNMYARHPNSRLIEIVPTDSVDVEKAQRSDYKLLNGGLHKFFVARVVPEGERRLLSKPVISFKEVATDD